MPSQGAVDPANQPQTDVVASSSATAAPPTISVVIPTYNRADLIIHTLESVRAQTFVDWECIVVDDGSTDETPRVVERFVAADLRFRYLARQNSSASAARNHGLSEARGKYIVFLDSDDLFPADLLEWQIRELEADPDAVFAYGDVFSFRNGNVGNGYLLRAREKQMPCGWAFETLLQCGCVRSPLTRTEAVRRVGGFDERLPTGEDWDMWLSLSKLGRIIYRPRLALYSRQHAGNKSANTLRNYHYLDRIARKQLRGFPLRTRIRLYRAARRFFRTGPWLYTLLKQADALNDAGDWPKARPVWRAVAYLDPAQLRHVRVLLNVLWAFVPTDAAPLWRPLWRRLRRARAGASRG